MKETERDDKTVTQCYALTEITKFMRRGRVPIRLTLNQNNGRHDKGEPRSSLISSGSAWQSGSPALPGRSLGRPGSTPGEGGSGCCSSCTGRPSVGPRDWSPRSCCSPLQTSSASSRTGSLRWPGTWAWRNSRWCPGGAALSVWDWCHLRNKEKRYERDKGGYLTENINSTIWYNIIWQSNGLQIQRDLALTFNSKLSLKRCRYICENSINMNTAGFRLHFWAFGSGKEKHWFLTSHKKILNRMNVSTGGHIHTKL